MTPLLEARAISRRFGHVRALDGADFAVHAGEICALIGDNGTLEKAIQRGRDALQNGVFFARRFITNAAIHALS